MAQYEAITGRRPYYGLSDMIRAEAPTARSMYYNNLSLDLNRRQQEQQARQFDQQLKQQEEINEQNQQNADISNAIGGIGTGVQLYDVGSSIFGGGGGSSAPVGAGSGGPEAVGDLGGLFGGGGTTAGGGTVAGTTSTVPTSSVGMSSAELFGLEPVAAGGSESVFGGTAATGGGTAASSGGAGAGGAGTAGGAGGGGAAGGSSGGMSMGTLGLIGAAIALGQLGVNNTSTEFEGHETGGWLTMDDGNWSPSPTNEPGIGYLYQADKLGYGPSSGEKMDAALHNQDYQKMGYRIPGAANQWVNPAADFGYMSGKKLLMNNTDLSEQDADLVMSFVDPVTGFGKLLEDADAGTFGGKAGGSATSRLFG